MKTSRCKVKKKWDRSFTIETRDDLAYDFRLFRDFDLYLNANGWRSVGLNLLVNSTGVNDTTPNPEEECSKEVHGWCGYEEYTVIPVRPDYSNPTDAAVNFYRQYNDVQVKKC